MNSVVVNQLLAVDAEPGAVVRQKIEAILARLLHPEPSGVVNGEPLKAIGDPREPFIKPPRRDVQRVRIDGSGRLHLLESWKFMGVAFQHVDAALKTRRAHYGCSKRVFRLLLGEQGGCHEQYEQRTHGANASI